MKILALEPYYGGSHRAFLDGWIERSEFEWTLLTLAPNKWKWRMRHAAVTFANEVGMLVERGEKWDALFCSDMLNLAEFAGLTVEGVRTLPKVVYFHENQLTYPVRCESERDYQFAVTNMTSALAADSVWFNSDFNRQSFLSVLEKFLKKMPDNQPFKSIEQIYKKSQIQPPGIESIESVKKEEGPLMILWAGRWEHDKKPEEFFAAIDIVEENDVDFRLNVIGESFRDCPEIFEQARAKYSDKIDRWGYQESMNDYVESLRLSDVVVSTAGHEFFGISVIEAIMSGCYPVLPERLAYPEVLGLGENVEAEIFFYDGSVKGLAEKLINLAKLKQSGVRLYEESKYAKEAVCIYKWEERIKSLDLAFRLIAGK